MKKKAVSLFLTFILSLVLTIPALAADQNTEGMLNCIILVRNGLLDEKKSEWQMKTDQPWLYSRDGTTIESEEGYFPFSLEDTWVFTNTGTKKCLIYLACEHLPWDVWNVASGPVGLYNFSKISVLCKSGGFVDMEDSSFDLSRVAKIGPGESISFSAKDFISQDDDGTRQIVYVLDMMFQFLDTGEETYTGSLYMFFMRDEAGTAECILKAMQSGIGIVSPNTPESPPSYSNFMDVSVNSPYKMRLIGR